MQWQWGDPANLGRQAGPIAPHAPIARWCPLQLRLRGLAPDGKSVAVSASRAYRGMVHLWDAGSGKFRKRLDVGDGALAFSPDGALLAVGSRVWDVAAGKELSVNDEAHRGPIECVVTGRGGVVVTASDDNSVRLWEAATGKQRHCFTHNGWVRGVALSPDGRRIASNSMDDTVCLWDAVTGRKIYRLAGHGQVGGHRAIAFTADGKSFLSWGDDLCLRRWDVRTGKAVLEVALRPTGFQVPDPENDPAPSFGLAEGHFAPDGKHLVLRAGELALSLTPPPARSCTGSPLRAAGSWPWPCPRTAGF